MNYHDIPCCSCCGFFSSSSLQTFPTAFNKNQQLLNFAFWMLMLIWYEAKGQKSALNFPWWSLEILLQLNVQDSEMFLLCPHVSGQHKLRVKLHKLNLRAPSAFRATYLHAGKTNVYNQVFQAFVQRKAMDRCISSFVQQNKQRRFSLFVLRVTPISKERREAMKRTRSYFCYYYSMEKTAIHYGKENHVLS